MEIYVGPDNEMHKSERGLTFPVKHTNTPTAATATATRKREGVTAAARIAHVGVRSYSNYCCACCKITKARRLLSSLPTLALGSSLFASPQ